MFSERKGVQKLSLTLLWQCTDALVVIALLQDPVDQPTGSSAWCIFSISGTVYHSVSFEYVYTLSLKNIHFYF